MKSNLALLIIILFSNVVISQDNDLQSRSQIFEALSITPKKSTQQSLKSHFKTYELYHLNSESILNWVILKNRHSHFTIRFGSKHRFDFKATEVDHGEHTQVFIEKDGKLMLQNRPMPTTLAVSVNENQKSSGVFTVNDGFLSAGFQTDGESWHIERLANYLKSAKADQYILYKGSDQIMDRNSRCGVSENDHQRSKFQYGSHTKNMMTPPFSNLCIDMQMVADSSFYALRGENTLNEMVAIFNMTHFMYQNNDIGLHLQLSTVILFENGDPYTLTAQSSTYDQLDSLQSWLNGSSLPHDNAQMLTTRKLSLGIAGLASVGSICNPASSSGLSVLQSKNISTAEVMAHELGHNLGAHHDSQGNDCNSSGFIMAAAGITDNLFKQFSSCSKDYFQDHNVQAQICAGCEERPCDSAIPLLSCTKSITGNTSVLSELSGLIPSCGDFIDGGAPGIWYALEGDGDTVRLSTCHDSTDFDTQIAVYRGECTNLVCVDGVNDDNTCGINNDYASYKFLSQKDTTYYIFISGRTNTDKGNYELTIHRDNLFKDNIIYVKANSAGGNDGMSWVTAFDSLHQAIEKSRENNFCGNVQIWVSEGTYKPIKDKAGNISSTSRFSTFYIDHGMYLYGGFPSSGTPTFEDRDWKIHETILSGDIGTLDDQSDNVYTIVRTEDILSKFVIDGFTLSGGNANRFGSYTDDTFNELAGGAIFSSGEDSTSIVNCTFKNNGAIFGGAVASTIDGGSLTIQNCVFVNNSASQTGGAIFSDREESNLTFLNTLFDRNTSNKTGGAINMYDHLGKNASVVNCTFFGNYAKTSGSAILNGSGNDSLTNCIFWANYGSSSIQSVQNTFMNFNIMDQANCPSGVNCGSGNIFGEYPQFLDTSNSDFTLLSCSPAIEAGDSTVTYSSLDLACMPRRHDADSDGSAGIDIGAFEFQGDIVYPPNLTSHPQSQSIAEGQRVVFKVSAAGTGTLTYQWQKDGVDLGGETNDSFVISIVTLADTGSYSVLVYEGICGTVSNAAVLTVTDPLVLHVDVNASGQSTGLTWADAFTDLQEAIDTFKSKNFNITTQIWVADGTYKPTRNTPGNIVPGSRNLKYYFDYDIQLFGGFSGTESSIAQRDLKSNHTILSGDINTIGDASDNVTTIVMTKNVTNAFILDGFHLTGGHADNDADQPERRRGGAFYNDGEGSGTSTNPRIANCRFYDNYALLDGGAVYNTAEDGEGSPEFTNCYFYNNSADDDGGGVFSFGDGGTANPSFINCSFYDNQANDDGGAIGYDDSDFGSMVVTNCTFFNNKASFGGLLGINFWDSGEIPLEVKNCIAWGNSSTFEVNSTSNGICLITYSLIEDATCPNRASCDANTIFNQYPDFADSMNHDFTLEETSLAINAGNPDTMGLSLPKFDLIGSTRIDGDTVDIGAFEFISPIDSCLLMSVILNDPLSSGIYKSGGDLESSSLIASGNIIFQAEQAILLEPNFTVNTGATFEAVIQNCVNALMNEERILVRK